MKLTDINFTDLRDEAIEGIKDHFKNTGFNTFSLGDYCRKNDIGDEMRTYAISYGFTGEITDVLIEKVHYKNDILTVEDNEGNNLNPQDMTIECLKDFCTIMEKAINDWFLDPLFGIDKEYLTNICDEGVEIARKGFDVHNNLKSELYGKMFQILACRDNKVEFLDDDEPSFYEYIEDGISHEYNICRMYIKNNEIFIEGFDGVNASDFEMPLREATCGIWEYSTILNRICAYTIFDIEFSDIIEK